MAETEIKAKVAVITGASSGIGQATALEFARQGYNVVLAARRGDVLNQVAEECETEGVRAIAVAADTTDEAAVQKVADTAAEMFGGFDVWVNDAAVSVYASFLETPLEDFRKVIDTNIMGYVHGARAALKQFRDQGHGTLIMISSINAVAPVPYSSAYVASKHAVRGLSESLRMELSVEGLASKIHVCNVMPASIDTNFFQNAANYTGREVRAVQPVYEPEYVAKHIVKLARFPRREIIVGPAAKAMAMEYMTMPWLYEKMMARFIDKDNFGEQTGEISAGSLYEPIPEHTGMHGGWREQRMRADKMNMVVGASVAALGVAIGLGYLLAHRAKSRS